MLVLNPKKDKPDFRDFDPETDLNYHNRRLASMEAEFSSWKSHMRELSENFMPRAGRFIETERNDGGKVHSNIVDSHGLDAVDTLGAGLMAGMSSPARPWMKIKTGNRGKNKIPAVKIWLDEVTSIMLDMFAQSNVYRVLHAGYEELGVFGTNASFALSDFKDVIRLYPMTIGEFMIAQNSRYAVDTCYRKFQMNVHQIVNQFGFENTTTSTQNLYRNRNFDKWVTVAHAVEPRQNAKHSSPLAINMDFLSNYWETGTGTEGQSEGKFLSRSGFQDFPVLAPRWKVKGQDIYGHSPGMKCLGDTKELQADHFKKARAKDFQSNPPLIIPTSLRGSDDWLPGGQNYADINTPHGGVKSAFEVNLDLSAVLEDIQDIRRRIDSGFFVDLFKTVIGSDRRQITAREIAEKHEEKLLLLGPVLERLQNEKLDKLVDRGFSLGIEADIFPAPPQELEGEEIQVEYISMLAQAQKAIGIGGIDRILGTIGAIAAFKPGVVDKLDENELVDVYADLLGTPAKIIVANEKVALLKQQRDQAEQAAVQSQLANETANTAKTLSEADTQGENALNAIKEQLLPF